MIPARQAEEFLDMLESIVPAIPAEVPPERRLE